MIRQHEIPPSFNNRWFIGGDKWEDDNAGRECEVLGYVTAEDGRDLCHVRFLDFPDLFAEREGFFTPYILFPVRDRSALTHPHLPATPRT